MKNEEISTVSTSTIRKIFQRAGLVARIKVKKQFLKFEHKKRRLEFARKFQNWTIEDWNRVVWSDESKFQIFGSNYREC